MTCFYFDRLTLCMCKTHTHTFVHTSAQTWLFISTMITWNYFKIRNHVINCLILLMFPGLMKFFGGLAQFHPKEVLNHFHNFVGLVFSSICHADQSIRGLAIDTVGFIGSTPEGKLALDKQGMFRKKWNSWNAFKIL